MLTIVLGTKDIKIYPKNDFKFIVRDLIVTLLWSHTDVNFIQPFSPPLMLPKVNYKVVPAYFLRKNQKTL